MRTVSAASAAKCRSTRRALAHASEEGSHSREKAKTRAVNDDFARGELSQRLSSKFTTAHPSRNSVLFRLGRMARDRCNDAHCLVMSLGGTGCPLRSESGARARARTRGIRHLSRRRREETRGDARRREKPPRVDRSEFIDALSRRHVRAIHASMRRRKVRKVRRRRRGQVIR